MKIMSTAAFLSLALLCASAAQADIFGSGLNAFNIDFVTIGNPGNSADTDLSAEPRFAGSVPYTFRIGEFEISEQMIDKANALGGLGITTNNRLPNKPATEVNWNEAARFVNWLNTSTGSVPAYKFAFQPGQLGYNPNDDILLWTSSDGAGYDPNNLFRNSKAHYFLPSTHEWYKAAFYDPTSGVYHDFASGSGSPPVGVASGTAAGTAVYGQTFATGPADVTLAGGRSPYGTMGQGGNVYEWHESSHFLPNTLVVSSREVRGGSWNTQLSDSDFLSATESGSRDAEDGNFLIGFRVAGVPPQPLSIAGLRNVDVVSPGDLEVNDFHITLHGITDPVLQADGGTQIKSTFPASFNTPNPNPPGWYPPVINTYLTPPPPHTVVTYGGPGAQFVGGSTKMHFGVSLTRAGEAALDEICMTWTIDGVPVSAGGNPSLPITIIPDQAARGETKVQIVNQVCPEEMTEGPSRWLGPIHMSILDRHAELDELLADSPIIVEAGVLFDGNTFLAPGEQITLADVDATSPVAAGKSIVVWYDVFEDDRGMPGRLIGTSYSAFNVSAVPEPTSVALVGMVAIALAGHGRRRL
jgi:sulfatase modifying factor 1